MPTIPDRERGYSVEPNTAIVHERYQDHAPRAMRTSALGVTNVLDGREPVPCPTCFPAPKSKGGKESDQPAKAVGITTSDLPKTEHALGSEPDTA